MGEHRGADSAAVVDEAVGLIRFGAASKHTVHHPQEAALRVEARTAQFKKGRTEIPEGPAGDH